MSGAANDATYSVQRFRGGFALVWRGPRDEADPTIVRHRRRLDAQDRQSAEAEARTIWEGADNSPWTVGRIMTAYLATIAHKPSHGRRKDAWKAMKTFWENVDPAMIDEPMAKKYRSTRQVGDATARYELMQLSTALNWAVEARKIDTRRAVWLPSTPERKTRHLTRAEFKRFFAAVKADHARVYVQIGLYTVARPTAILELTWDRVDFMRRRIDFTPPGHVRTAKRRTVVSIGDILLAALQDAYKVRTCTHVIERGGAPVKCIKKAFQAASERSGVHATPYTLRHTGAVWAAEGGVSMPELAQMMGHDDDRTTQKHYAVFSPEHLKGVVDAIEGTEIQKRGSM
jgi:integrase